MDFPEVLDDDEDMQLFLKELQLAGYDWEPYLLADPTEDGGIEPKGMAYWILDPGGRNNSMEPWFVSPKGYKIVTRYLWVDGKWRNRPLVR